ncbi:MAG: hypothetical protein ABFD62_11480 [Syntrophaceae bacterium]
MVSKVQCKTCGSVHKYRNGAKKAAPGKREPAARTAKSKSSVNRQTKESESQVRWQKKKDAMPADPDIIDYSPQSGYGPSDIIRHATFGLGFVDRVLSKTRVEILFQTGLKLMLMNTVSK